MACLVRPPVAWLLAAVMPFQALTAVHLDVRGPAHFHVAQADDHDRDHGHGHAHAHDRVERHHHHPGDASIANVNDGRLPESLALEDKASGWSSTMLAALPASGASPRRPETRGGFSPRPEPLLKTRSPGRLERPPRIVPA